MGKSNCETKQQPLCRLKLALFRGLREPLSESSAGNLLYGFLLVIETIQLSYYCISDKFTFLWPTPFTKAILYSIKFFTISGWIFEFPVVKLYLACICLFILLLINAVFIRQALFHKSSKSFIDRYLVSGLNTLLILFKTVLYIPFLEAFLACVTVPPDSQFSSIHYAIGTVGLVLFALTAIIVNYFFISSSPFRPHPLASLTQHNDLIKNIIKIIPPVYVASDSNGSSATGFLILMILIYLVWYIVHLGLPPLYNPRMDALYSNTPIVCLWLSLSCAIQSFFRWEIQGIVFMLLGVILVVAVGRYLKRRYSKSIIHTETKSYRQFLIFVVHIINALQNLKNNPENLDTIMGIFSSHYSKCRSPGCYCQKIIQNIQSKTPLTAEKWYNFLNSILQQQLDELDEEQGMTIHFLISEIYIERLGNTYRSIYHLSKASYKTPSLFLQLQTFTFRGFIQQHISTQNNKRDTSVNLQNLFEFHDLFSKFRKSLFDSCCGHSQFWSELQDDHLDGIKLFELSSTLNSGIEKLRKDFEELTSLNEYCSESYAIFYQFLKNLRGIIDQDLKQRIDKVKAFLQKKGKLTTLNYWNPSDVSIITVSANENQMGKILYANRPAFELLGYRQKDLIGNDIDCIVPKYLQEIHSEMFRDYVWGTKVKQSHLRKVYIVTKSNNILYATIKLQTHSDISDGVALIGYITQSPIEGKYLLTDSEGQIIAVSNKFQKFFQVSHDYAGNLKQLLEQGVFSDLILKDAAINTPTKCVLRIISQNKNASVRRFNEAEWQVNIYLKQRQFFNNDKTVVYLFTLLDEQSDQDSKSLVLEIQDRQAKARSETVTNLQIKTQREIETHQKMYLEVQDIVQSTKQPKRLIWLKRLAFVAFLSFLILTSVEITLTFNRLSYGLEHAEVLWTSSKLRMSIIKVALASRKLHLAARGNFTDFPTDFYNGVVSQASSDSNYYNTIRQRLQKAGIYTDPVISFITTLPSFTNRTDNVTLTAAVLQYLTACANLQKTTRADLDFPLRLYSISPPVTAIQLSMMMIRNNALNSIVPGFIQLTRGMVNSYYSCMLSDCKEISLIILALEVVIVMTMTIIGVVIHIRFSNIGRKVLGSLSYLDRETINQNMNTIESYKAIHFRQFKPVLSEVTKQPNSYMCLPRESIDRMSSLRCSSRQNSNAAIRRAAIAQQLDTGQPDTIREKKSKTKFPGSEQKNKAFKERVARLSQAKITDGWKTWVRYAILSIVLIVCFATDYVLAKVNTSELVDSNASFDIICKRSEYLFTIRYFTLETMYAKSTIIQEKTKFYLNNMYQNDRLIQKSTSITDGIIKMFEGKNICSNIDLFGNYSDSAVGLKECQTIHNQVLTDGLRSSIVTFADLAQSVYSKNISTQSDAFDLLNRPEYQQFSKIEEYIRAVITYQKDLYRPLLQTATESRKTGFIIKLVAFLLLLIPVYWCWGTLMSQMSSLVTNIKGLISIISFDRINQIEPLKEQLLKSNTLQSLA